MCGMRMSCMMCCIRWWRCRNHALSIQRLSFSHQGAGEVDSLIGMSAGMRYFAQLAAQGRAGSCFG